MIYDYIKKGNINAVVEFIEDNDFPEYYSIDHIIDISCRYKQLKIIKHLRSIMNHPYMDDYIFIYACKNNSIDILKYIISVTEEDITINNGIEEACKNGNIKIIKYLSILYEILIDAFKFSCKYGQLNILKYLLSFKKFDINEIFIKACENNFIKVVKNYIDEIDMKLIKKMFKYVCNEKKCLDIVNYLAPMMDKKTYNKGFIIACENGYIKVAKILVLRDIDKKIDLDDETFRFACSNNYIKIVKYMISLKDVYRKIDIHYQNEAPYKCACLHYCHEVVEYLLSLQDEYGKIIIPKPRQF